MSGFIVVVDTAADVEEEDFEFNPPPELCLPRSMAYVSMVPTTYVCSKFVNSMRSLRLQTVF